MVTKRSPKGGKIHHFAIGYPKKNRLFKKKNVYVQRNPLEYGIFSTKCNLHKGKFDKM
jgi:hypothetical protein